MSEKSDMIANLVKNFPSGGGVSYLSGANVTFANFEEKQLELFKNMVKQIVDGKKLVVCPYCKGDKVTVAKYDPKPLLNKYTYKICKECSGTGFVIV